MSSTEAQVAPCGIDCVNCEVFEDNLTPEMRARMAAYLKLEPGKVPCRGCRVEKGCRLHYAECPTLDCVTAKGHEFCFECKEFPCAMLQPTADQAAKLPHNLKVFNLCRIKSVGVRSWLEQEAKGVRARYYRGKMIVGRGPVLE